MLYVFTVSKCHFHILCWLTFPTQCTIALTDQSARTCSDGSDSPGITIRSDSALKCCCCSPTESHRMQFYSECQLCFAAQSSGWIIYFSNSSLCFLALFVREVSKLSRCRRSPGIRPAFWGVIKLVLNVLSKVWLKCPLLCLSSYYFWLCNMHSARHTRTHPASQTGPRGQPILWKLLINNESPSSLSDTLL